MDHPPNKIFKISTRRYEMTENAKDKQKFIEESSSDSLYSAQKFEAIEEISNDGNSEVDTDGRCRSVQQKCERKKILLRS
uniref:Uncharacterized protein n=1 Tax=Trichogramma kaykai TaxID=54128 RepID=A0ABD2WYT3_9HYME